ncbi:MAG TPA: UDP-N-acetylmuramate dehydrogenase [Peptococcaceae bacterium]|nr:UDP-N-acetylmuramate dehydrogenase [Peptococcaceae bacterium]
MDLPLLKGRLERDYPLSKLNTWKIGGRGEIVFWPATKEDLVTMVEWCRKKELPFLLLGRGSNVLLPDDVLRGITIVTTDLKKITWEEETVTCEAGYSLMRLAREAAERSLSGLEFASGIPGTVGAAVAINAGAFGGEIGRLVKNVLALTLEGEVLNLSAPELSFEYRKSSLLEKNYLVLETTLKLTRGEKSVIKKNMEDFKVRRKAAQPWEYPNAGSVFRNPQGDSAGRLIELAGWKGRQIGDAQVSEEHANFIVNKGKAKASDVRKLIVAIQEDVKAKFNIELETEVRIIC